jgi:hypothetical protein
VGKSRSTVSNARGCGYVYLTAIPETGAGTDWWARKLNP